MVFVHFIQQFRMCAVIKIIHLLVLLHYTVHTAQLTLNSNHSAKVFVNLFCGNFRELQYQFKVHTAQQKSGENSTLFLRFIENIRQGLHSGGHPVFLTKKNIYYNTVLLTH